MNLTLLTPRRPLTTKRPATRHCGAIWVTVNRTRARRRSLKFSVVFRCAAGPPVAIHGRAVRRRLIAIADRRPLRALAANATAEVQPGPPVAGPDPPGCPDAPLAAIAPAELRPDAAPLDPVTTPPVAIRPPPPPAVTPPTEAGEPPETEADGTGCCAVGVDTWTVGVETWTGTGAGTGAGAGGSGGGGGGAGGRGTVTAGTVGVGSGGTGTGVVTVGVVSVGAGGSRSPNAVPAASPARSKAVRRAAILTDR